MTFEDCFGILNEQLEKKCKVCKKKILKHLVFSICILEEHSDKLCKLIFIPVVKVKNICKKSVDFTNLVWYIIDAARQKSAYDLWKLSKTSILSS